MPDTIINYRGFEEKKHDGVYAILTIGRGRQVGYVDCPFCNQSIKVYLWSISGGGKKCDCGAILYRKSAERKK